MSDDILFRDKDGATVTTRATDNAGVKSIHHIIETLESGVPTPVSAAAPLPVSVASTTVTGTVTVDGSGVTQPVSGPLTDAELRATAVPVSIAAPAVEYGLAVSAGMVPGVSSLNKFGRAPAGVQITSTDIWSRADAAATQQIWLAPTTARIHAIASASAADVAGGTGATSVTIWGLTAWNAAESSETVNLNGTTPVNTANSYVIIHRMKAISQATTTNAGINAGTITATAATDGTITAEIVASQGQTQMAIYGVPSGKTLYVKKIYAYMNDSSATARIDLQLRVNEKPDVSRLSFINKLDIQLMTSGDSAKTETFCVPLKFAGPCILKLQGTSNAADVDCSGGFDGFIM